jgi:hypothetical protein
LAVSGNLNARNSNFGSRPWKTSRLALLTELSLEHEFPIQDFIYQAIAEKVPRFLAEEHKDENET